MAQFDQQRRFLLSSSLVVGTGLVLSTVPAWADKEEEEISPAEDLMREHGLLNRILLIYEEAIRRIQNKQNFDSDIIKQSATLIKKFIEDYHEKNEEQHVFPRLRKAGKLVPLVDTLEAQHKAGRKVTANILQLASPSTLQNQKQSGELKAAMHSFITMYRPHESREDTVLFPEFQKLLSKKEIKKLGEEFEKQEHKFFGEHGFEDVVRQVESLEKAFAIYDLSQFTPK